MSRLGPVSTNYLSANNRIALEELLHNARFFDLPPRLPLVEVVPGDVLQEITVGNKEVTRTVVYERDGARRPKELDEIVAMLERLAGWQTIRQSAVLPRGCGGTGVDADRYGASAGRQRLAADRGLSTAPSGRSGHHRSAGFYPAVTQTGLPPGPPPPAGSTTRARTPAATPSSSPVRHLRGRHDRAVTDHAQGRRREEVDPDRAGRGAGDRRRRHRCGRC